MKTRVGVGGHSTQLTGGETKMDKKTRAAHLQCEEGPPGGDNAQRTEDRGQGGVFRQLKTNGCLCLVKCHHF